MGAVWAGRCSKEVPLLLFKGLGASLGGQDEGSVFWEGQGPRFLASGSGLVAPTALGPDGSAVTFPFWGPGLVLGGHVTFEFFGIDSF